MSEITKMELWAGALYPYTKWDDADGNNRVSLPELRPLPEIKDPSTIEGINAEINGFFRPMIKHLDKNGDGASFEEVREAFFPQRYDYDVDYNEAAQRLLSGEPYRVPGRPIMFVTEGTIPQEIKNLEYYQKIASRDIEAGACKTMRVAFVDGRFDYAPFLTKEAFCVVYISPKYIQEARQKGVKQLINIMRHEMVHVKQDLTGRSDETEGLSMLIAGRMDFASEQDMWRMMQAGIGNDILELEAYKTTILDNIEQGDVAEVKESCAKMNIYLASVNKMLAELKAKGLSDLASCLEKMLSEGLTRSEISEINEKAAPLLAEIKDGREKYLIHADISIEEWVRLYDRSDLR